VNSFPSLLGSGIAQHLQAPLCSLRRESDVKRVTLAKKLWSGSRVAQNAAIALCGFSPRIHEGTADLKNRVPSYCSKTGSILLMDAGI